MSDIQGKQTVYWNEAKVRFFFWGPANRKFICINDWWILVIEKQEPLVMTDHISKDDQKEIPYPFDTKHQMIFELEP